MHRLYKRAAALLILTPMLLLAFNAIAFAAEPGSPDKVSGLHGTAGNKSVTITFNKNAGGEIPDDYQIHWWNNGPDEDKAEYMMPVKVQHQDIPGSAYSYTFTGLNNDKTYYFKVYAHKAPYYYSDRTEIISVTPTAKKTIPVVDGVKAEAVDGQIQLTFNKNASAEASDTYVIDYWNGSSDESKAQNLKAVSVPHSWVAKSTYTYTLSDAVVGKTYYFAVYLQKSDKSRSDSSVVVSATAGQSNADKEALIKKSYADAFGRAPTASELAHWKGRADWKTYEDLIKIHRAFIRTDAKTQTDLVHASYFAVYWRGPDAAELAYWQGLLKSNGNLYSELVTTHKSFLKTSKEMREALIHNAFRTTFGRDASAAELKAWADKISGGKMTSFADLVGNLRGIVKGDPSHQASIVRLSYKTAFNRNETADELKYWKGVIGKSGTHFSEMMSIHREFIKKDKNTRTALINGSYKEVFNRTPDKGEAAFWEARLKQYGLIYGEIVLAHKDWMKNNPLAITKSTDLKTALSKKGYVLNEKTGNIEDAKTKKVVLKNGQYFFGQTDAKGNITSLNGSSIIASGGLNVIAAGGGNVIAAGGGNVIAAGGGNVIAAGDGNIIASGGLNVIAAGGGNIIASGGLNVIASGGLNLNASANPGNLLLLNGANIGGMK